MFLTVSKWDVYFGFVRPIELASKIVRSEKRAHEKKIVQPCLQNPHCYWAKKKFKADSHLTVDTHVP